MSAARQTLDDLHGDVVVASVTVTLTRAMNMSISGTITDEDYIVKMLESAADYLRSQQAKRRLTDGGQLVVPGYDTALHRTPEEARLIAARHDIADAM
jgi:hypothetical protein